MTWIIAILRFFGFIEQAEKFFIAYENKKKSQEIANAPLTDKEEADGLLK